ncbi:MAG TPA: PrsW family glutamic-type intramembrane protease, partial [Anaerolineales bacterium]|nr:PrsW family glutamic-type intramembrane protease [Anaerolineales bacterium]
KTEQTIFLAAFGFEGITLLAAAFFSFQKFLRRPSVDQEVSFSVPVWLIIALTLVGGVSILIGYGIGEIKAINWLVLPILTIPAVVFPLLVLLMFGARKLPVGTRWQTWNILGLGMTLAPFLLFTFEIIVGLVILFIVIAYIVTQPHLASDLQTLSDQIMVLGPQSQAAIDLLAPLVTKPAVIVTILIYVALLVPIIEEIFKPLGVWLFAGKLDTPAQGFTLGALSGAAYGLIETLNISGQPGDWAVLLFSRIGTGLLHITTSALMGAAIVLAWRQRRYLRLLGTYLLAVLFHGSWNALAVLFSISDLSKSLDQPDWLHNIQQPITIAMVILAMGLFAILVITNRRLRKTVSPALVETTVPPENMDTSLTP